MRKLSLLPGCFGLVMIAALAVQAQPANDNFANAWALTGLSVTTNGNSAQPSNATRQDGEPWILGTANIGGRSVWFSWAAPVSGTVRVDTAGSGFNTLLGVYTGNAVSALSLVVSNDNAPGVNTSLVEFQAQQGTTYRIVVDGRANFGGARSGPYNLRLQVLASVVITTPASGTIFQRGTPIPLSVSATVPSPPVTRVEMYSSFGPIGTNSTAPYNFVANNAPLGTNLFGAVAYDSSSNGWQSAVINVLVLDEGITILAPVDGTVLTNTNPLTISAAAMISSGSMTNIEFFVDGLKIGEDAASPFSAVWSGVTEGVHRITAVGRDSTGRTWNSAPVMIGVVRTLVPFGSAWRYLDDGSDQGTNWITPAFDDSRWASGPAPLGYGDSNGRLPATTNSFGLDAANKHPTTYYRQSFVVTNVAGYTNFVMNLQRDDGAVIFLNGAEVGRYNMPAGIITYTDFSAANANDDGTTTFTEVFSPAGFMEGTNLLAVEIHQDNGSSSDIWMQLELLGVPIITRNQSPNVALTNPTNGASFLAPAAITLTATASDADGSVAKVEFFADGIKLGETTSGAGNQYGFVWNSPPIGWHQLTAVATDNEGSSQVSAPAAIAVYDAIGSPLVAVTSPADGTVMVGPTNLPITAEASAISGVTNVQFLANGAVIGNDVSSPYNIVWMNSPFGSNGLLAVAFGANGLRGTSALVRVTINTPPTNTIAPIIIGQIPAAGATITNLTSIQVRFSEPVVGVDASDLLVNGNPATTVSGGGSNYTFTVTQPPLGTVSVTWATGHGITDIGWPSSLPFNGTGPGASWTYNLADLLPPAIVDRNPPADAVVTNLTQIAVTFSEPVAGVDAADLLVNGQSAIGLSGGGSSYTFSFSQPPAGLVAVSWATGHGIADLASPPNAFNATGPGATWSCTLDDRTILVQSNATWLFIKGLAEASTPTDAWRNLGFNDSGWSNALAPFFYGDPYNSATDPGTLLSDMQGGYSSIYLRKTFIVANPSAVTNLLLRAQSDDGFIAWINGVEVVRYNMPPGDFPYNGETPSSINEPNNRGAEYLGYTLPDPSAYLVAGTNVLAVHAFNNQPATSSDFGFNAQLYTYLADPALVAPRIAAVTPPAGDVFFLTNVAIRFSEPVTGVDASDLLIDGVVATTVTGGSSNDVFTFGFPRPAYGPVSITWAVNPGIWDFDSPPKPFDGTAFGSTFQYNFLNPSAPTVAMQSPLAGARVTNLTQITVTFSEPVTGVGAADLRINGVPAAGLTGGGLTFAFTFPQPPYGPVSVAWVTDHGIADLEVPPNAFDASRPAHSWSYTLVDEIPPVIANVDPARGALVTNLTQVTVTFSEPVNGVDASDFRVNGTPADTVAGSGDTYTFAFAQPNATSVNITWASPHGIQDLAAMPNGFDAAAAGATWSYTTPDTLPPVVTSVDPPAYVTVRSLNQIRVWFSEPVAGVDTNDLLINNRPARQVNGSGAGPYTFSFLPPSNGVVDVRWALMNGITDLATSPNAFAGGEWTYLLDPNAAFAGKILINEIMFNPPDGSVSNEWIEIRNITTNLINVAGWQFTRGVDFTFPNVAIAASGYLVVAADVSSFRAKYPAVTNVVGGWTGRLANSDETIELVTALGETVSSVHYASEGDWARRERGHGAHLVDSIVRNGSTATVTIFGHGISGTDQVIISGAEQSQYNGRFTLSGVGVSTFNITVSGTPDSPATGNIICRHVLDNGQAGWSWYCPADGLGSSLELINPAMPADSGQNWASSSALNGTPGQPNSVLSNNVAPLLMNVTHFPPVPRSADPVTVSARVQDELPDGVQGVTLFYRDHSTTSPDVFSTTNLVDDGLHGDGVANDGLYGVVLPPSANGAIMEFYVQATDVSGLRRTWPAATWNTNNTVGQLANALYQVDDEAITNTMPSLRVVMTGTEDAIFPPSDRGTDAEMNTTLISLDGDGARIRYLCGVRVRGAGSRSRTPPNNRLNIPNDNRWNNLDAINLNGQFVHAQLMGSVVAQKSGLPAADAYVVQYRINGVNPADITPPQNGSGNGDGWGTFLLVEPVNGDLADNLFPQNPAGNVYRASTGNHNADLSYRGTNPSDYLTRGYTKTSNQSENDWTDLMNLTYAFSQVAPDADYYQALSTNLNLEMWMRFFAVGSLVNYGETSLFNGRGDDYAMYRGINDPRFVFIGHDFDTIFGQGDTSTYYATLTNATIWTMINPQNPNANVPLLRRFMTNNVHAPVYFGVLKHLCDTVFHPDELNPLMDQLLTGWGVGPSAAVINAMKNHASNRRDQVLAQIPLALTISHSLSFQNGYPSTTTPNVNLAGNAHAIDTRKVLVNGVDADWSAWEARWTRNVMLQPGVNRVLVQSLNSNNVEFARATADVWYDDGSVQPVSGSISTDTVWSAAGGPYTITANLTVASGATLTIQPGTTVYLGSGVNLAVANGGRLIAEGTATAPIRFTRAPGASTTWGGITIDGGAGSPETRVAHAHIEFNNSTAIHSTDGTLSLVHVTFGNTARQYLSLDRSSFVVRDCVFPTATAGFELVHGTGGIKSGGRGLFVRNFFGAAIGYNDVVDFTGGNRPGQPILQVLDNVFVGTSDDLLDLDGADAWIEGNIFMHAHKNGSPDTASAVSSGPDGGQTSEITMVGNLIYDCDHAAMVKDGNFTTLLNNTVVRQTRQGGTDADAAVACLADEGFAQGAGMYLEGNILYDIENLVRFYTNSVVTFTNNLMPLTWSGPGGGNSTNNPLLNYLPQLAETTNFTSWAEAQVVREWFSLRPGSPALGAGPNRRDLGGAVPMGASLSGEPVSPTSRSSALLRVGVNRKGSGIPAAGWPDGSGFTHYKWRRDGGSWSAEIPIATPIVLSGLAEGPHFVEVVGRNDAGLFQDDPALGSSAVVTRSRTWVVSSDAPVLRLNELLASNSGAVIHSNTTPDCIELHNPGTQPVDLAGVRITDDPQAPDKFIFPTGASIPANGYLVVFANNPDGTPGYHLGFNLNQEGESVYLYDAVLNGGALLDSITFGPQLNNLSIGRLSDETWALTLPTFGGPNQAAPLGDPRKLRINEWLAIGVMPFGSDFVELYNPDPLPVALGGLFVSDEIMGWPTRHVITPLSFIGGYGYLRLIADGNPDQGADHLNFRLGADLGEIALYLPDLTPIDCVFYQPQNPNVSQGRSPNGGNAIVFFDTPTPGAPNPIVTGPAPFGGALVINEVLAVNATLAEGDGRTPDWIEFYNGTTNSIDLGDLSVTDDPLQPRRFVLPAGAQILPGGHLRVTCDPNATSLGPLVNTNFALKSTGGGVYLFDRPTSGGSLLNSILYGLQVADLSIGRVPDGSTNWVLTSPTPAQANAAIPTLGNPSNLRVNEWMANPEPGADDWFEIYNPNTQPVALGGLYLTDRLDNRTKHQIAPLSFVGTGTNAFWQFHADNNTGAGADHVSFALSASGEAVGLSMRDGTLIHGMTFGPQTEGISEGLFPDGDTNVVAFPGTASPGESNYRWLAEVVINEVLTHTDEPLEDAIELRNLTSQPLDISGWWLSDDRGTLEKYQIPSPRILPANGFTVIFETHFTNREQAAIPFALSSQGDEVVLSAYSAGALTGYRATVRFGAADNGVSFGRFVTSDNREEFVAMNARTFGVDDPSSVEEFRMGSGGTNAYPRVGPIVISEIMYHPPDSGTNDNVEDEFIELHNITTAPVALFDPAHPTNTWRLRDAVDYDFAPGTEIPAGGYLLVVSFDPVNNPVTLAAFRGRYNVAAEVPIVGPYSGRLANSDDDLELRKPGDPDTNGVPSILVERVHYYDAEPWPSLADGTGFSLQRINEPAYGNDPINWTAAAPTPGPQGAPIDFDGDGMPDFWEYAYNLDPYNPADAAIDSDGDGLTNLQEFQAGTNPRNPQSALRFESIALAVSGTDVVLTFKAVADRSYTVQYADGLGGGWQTLEDIDAGPTDRTVQLTVPAVGGLRFYRLATPKTAQQSVLRFQSIQPGPGGGQVTLTLIVPANQSATVEFKSQLGAASWSTVTNFPSASSDRILQVAVPATGPSGFYRVRSP